MISDVRLQVAGLPLKYLGLNVATSPPPCQQGEQEGGQGDCGYLVPPYPKHMNLDLAGISCAIGIPRCDAAM